MRARTPVSGRSVGLPHVLLACLCAAVVVGGPSVAAGEDEHTLIARYRIEALGLPIGEARLVVRLNGQAYDVEARASTSGIATLFADASSKLNATGALIAGVVRPATFSQKLEEGGKTSRVELAFSGDRVEDVSIDPPPSGRRSNRVPLTDAHRRDVVDPASALLSAMSGLASVDAASACDRTVAVFTGETRFDIRLRAKGTREYDGGKPLGGRATVCGMDYLPVAGHKPHSKDVAFQAENRDNEIWFAPVDAAGLLVPVLWRLKFRPGRVDIVLSKVRLR